MKKIYFFNEEINFNVKEKTKIRDWIEKCTIQNHKILISLNYIFTSDKHLISINQEYLHHNTFTDIITFDQSTNPKEIEGDIFISIDRVKENSRNQQTSFYDELHRVMIHGVLHLLGYSDKSEREKKDMRKKENHYLALRD